VSAMAGMVFSKELSHDSNDSGLDPQTEGVDG
jgi:hypothetical protein